MLRSDEMNVALEANQICFSFSSFSRISSLIHRVSKLSEKSVIQLSWPKNKTWK